MAVQGVEWPVALVGLIIIIVFLWRWRLGKRRVIESLVLSVIRARNGATLDDVILGAHISADEAGEILRKFLAKGILKLEEKDGQTIYKMA
jgi:predicted transcriptional regulator